MRYSARHSKVVRQIWQLDATDVRRALIDYLKADRNFPFPAESKYEDVDIEILGEEEDHHGTKIVVTWHAEDDVRSDP